MEASKLREQTDDELEQLRSETRKQLFDLKIKKGVGGTLDQPLELRRLRRDLARIETVIRERELASEHN
jgi:large subunit ribosomal protein L29